MDPSRRNVLLSALFGAGWVGLRALATGLPAAILANPRTARADTPTCQATKPQYLVFSTSASGDPLGCNVPGTYVSDPSVAHPNDPAFAATNISLGGTQVQAANVWSTLGPTLLARTCFFHHATYTGGHGDAPKVNKLQGEVKRQEMLVSLLAAGIAPCLKTVQSEPVVLDDSPLISFRGAVLPHLSAKNLSAVLGAPQGPLLKLQQIRDAHVDKLNALFKQSGTTAQRAILDRYALSQTQVRSLSQQLLGDLASIKDGQSYADQNTAAAILLKMNVTPVVVVSYGFGGDNHTDGGLAGEIAEYKKGVGAIVDLYARLAKYGLSDATSLAIQNVFGRTFVKTDDDKPATEGRTHNSQHHCSVFIGAGFKGSVIGGIVPDSGDYRASAIDSSSGAASASGDIAYEETLTSAGKTLAAGVGLNAPVIDDQITKGKVIRAALA